MKERPSGRGEVESQNIAVLDMKKLLNKEKLEKEKALESLKKLEIEKKELEERIKELMKN